MLNQSLSWWSRTSLSNRSPGIWTKIEFDFLRPHFGQVATQIMYKPGDPRVDFRGKKDAPYLGIVRAESWISKKELPTTSVMILSREQPRDDHFLETADSVTKLPYPDVKAWIGRGTMTKKYFWVECWGGHSNGQQYQMPVDCRQHGRSTENPDYQHLVE